MSGSEPLIPPLEGTLPGTQPGTLPGTQPGAPASGAPAAAPDELIGRELSGRYRIVQKLGEGAMGAVYIGEHVRMGRRDAIKVLRGPLAGDAEAVRRFNRGARNISAVHHPNVCTIYDFSDTAEGVTFLAMELITGESLRELLEREGALPPERAVSIARQVADALQAAHDAGIVHRDLKPANIMITRGRDGGDVVKVVDFDIAKAYDEAEGPEVTRVGFVVGTPEYMSPEQLIGERLDGRSDLYSLGLVLFRMLTGTLPFRADTPQELMLQRLTVQPMSLAQAAPGRAFPEPLESALHTVLSIKPGERQPSAAVFAREITAALGVPLSAAPPGPATLPPTVIAPAGAGASQATPATAAGALTTPRRRPALLVGAGVAGVLLVGGIAWFARPKPAREHARAPAPSTSGQATTSAAVTPPAPAAPPGGTTAATKQVALARPAPANPGASPANDAAGPAPAARPAPPARTDTGAQLAGRPASSSASGYTAAVTPPDATPAAGAGRTRLAPEQRERIRTANEVTFRLFERLQPGLPVPEVLAIRDTARGIFEERGAGPKNRGFAAYIVANTFINLHGRNDFIVTWLQRSVDFGYGPAQNQLEYYRSKSQ